MHAYKVRPIRYAHGFCWALFCCGYATVVNVLILSIYLYSLVLLHWHWRSRMIVTSQKTRFMGPTWDPPGSCRPQVGPMLVPWTLLSGTLWTWVNSTSNQPQQHNKVQNVFLTLGKYCTNNMYIYIHILYLYMYTCKHIIYDDFGARMAGTTNYMPHYLWDVITCPCPKFLLLASTLAIIQQSTEQAQSLKCVWKTEMYM